MIRRAAAGAIGGSAASAPMGALMLALQRTLPKREQYDLPPRQITSRIISPHAGAPRDR